MSTFVRLSEKQRKLFFTKLKENISSSWDNFYPKYNRSRAMFFNYMSGKYDLPHELFVKWKKIAEVELENIKKIEKQKYIQKEIAKINLNKDLAEIIGVLNGDGYISPLNYEICVVGNCHEKNYLYYLKKLFEKNFRINFNYQIDKSKFKLRGYSIKLFDLLTKEYGLPKGNKMGKLKIPLKIKENKDFLISYIRGLFDTDGTIYTRRKRDPVIEISSGDNKYLKEVKQTLNSLGFKAGIGKHRTFIYNKEDVRRFFNLIKPANTKHLKKYKEYLKLSAGGPENLIK